MSSPYGHSKKTQSILSGFKRAIWQTLGGSDAEKDAMYLFKEWMASWSRQKNAATIQIFEKGKNKKGLHDKAVWASEKKKCCLGGAMEDGERQAQKGEELVQRKIITPLHAIAWLNVKWS